jgi:hypothetical protein
MQSNDIIALLVAERDKLNAAIEALQGFTKKPVVAETASAGGGSGKATVAATAPKKRKVSAAARKRMAEGQKKRWAAIKAGK